MENKTSMPILLHKHSVISCALQCGWHKGMSLAYAPALVFGGQGIAYNGRQYETVALYNVSKYDAVFWQLFYIACYSQLIIKSMTTSEIKFNTIKLINGIKYMTKNQVEHCKSYVRLSLKLEDTNENNNAIEEAIKIYFEQPS